MLLRATVRWKKQVEAQPLTAVMHADNYNYVLDSNARNDTWATEVVDRFNY